MKVVTNSREAFQKYVSNNNLKCRSCDTQQVADSKIITFDALNQGKWFICLKCGVLNFELIRHGIETAEKITGPFPNPSRHYYRVVLEYPRAVRRFKVPANCPANVVRDYKEAENLLKISPMASAAFSRRCLQTLLSVRGYKHKNLIDQIKALLEESDRSKMIPFYIAKSIDVVRNFGNFSAHEILDQETAAILDVEPGEAEWSIELVEQLLDYYYVKLAEEEQKIADLNKKLVAAGKPPILQPPETQAGESISGADES